MLKSVLNKTHHALAKSASSVKLFLLLRNQCNAIIAYYLVSSPNSDKNGENLIVKSLAKQCTNVIDVGANKGDWSRFFLSINPQVSVFMVEPFRGAFNNLNKSFGNITNIHLINKAASDEEGETFFFEEPDSGETSSLVPTFSSSGSTKTKVYLTTIDALGKEYSIDNIDFLKIDVEGFDFFVLKGAKKYLEEKRIRFIQFEYNTPWAKTGSTLFYAVSYLEQYGYKTFLLRKDGLYHFDYDRYGEFYRYANFFSCQDNQLNAVASLIKGSI